MFGAAFAQSSTSLNVSPTVNANPAVSVPGVNPSTLNNSAIGSGNFNENSTNALNGNSAFNGNSALNGSANGTSAANGLSNSALN